jgi:drug/metabolite transporter (DMT)-like permease
VLVVVGIFVIGVIGRPRTGRIWSSIYWGTLTGIFILALSEMTLAPVSAIAPARELSMMVGVLFGRWLLDEPKVSARLAGAALIATGVATLSLA